MSYSNMTQLQGCMPKMFRLTIIVLAGQYLAISFFSLTSIFADNRTALCCHCFPTMASPQPPMPPSLPLHPSQPEESVFFGCIIDTICD